MKKNIRFTSFKDMLKHYAGNGRTAFVFERNGEKKTLTYEEVLELTDRRSSELKKETGSCIGIFTSSSPECIITILSAVATRMQVVLLDEDQSDDTVIAQIKATDIDCLYSDDPAVAEEFRPHLTSGIGKESDGILFFTSGTTGSSKAVVLSEKSLCSSAYNGSAMLPLKEEDILMCMLPLNHVFGFVCSLLWGLSCGATVALGRGMRYITQDLGYFEPTAVSLVPLLLGFLLKGKLLNDDLETILIGAGDCPQALLDMTRAMGKRVCFGYGLTETSSGVAISVDGDPKAMSICPDDRISIAADGEVLIEAPTCMMKGYYKDKISTDRVLKDGVLYTGDLGFIDEEGKLHITGRKKEIIVLPNGTKVFLPEYEQKIANALENTELAVILLKDRLALVIKALKDDLEDIRGKVLQLMKELPRAQQISDIIIREEALPKTASGKIKRWIIEKEENEKNG